MNKSEQLGREKARDGQRKLEERAMMRAEEELPLSIIKKEDK